MTEPSQYPIPVASAEEIAAFIARHGTPYDPETDNYQREPFIADIREGKNDPIYNAHSYHTKVPPRAIIPYILHYTDPGDIIHDPFCGSGMTGVAALMCGDPPSGILGSVPGAKKGARRAILNDLSPAACHITYNYCTQVDVDALKVEFERIKAAVKEEFNWLYGTEHYEPAVGIYDVKAMDVASRLKELPTDVTLPNEAPALWNTVQERSWELVNRAEIEKRLGYPVQNLSFNHRTDLTADFDLTKVERWIVIPAVIQYTIWSDVYRCEGMVGLEEPTGKISTRGKNAGKAITRTRRVARGCQKEIILWDVGVDRQTGKVRETFPCPHCGQEWRKIDLPRAGSYAVVSSLSYEGLHRGKSRTQPAHLDYGRPYSQREKEKLDDIVKRPIPTWVPDVPLNPKDPQYTRNALGGRKLSNVRDFFTVRNLRALSCVFWQIQSTQDHRLRRALLFAFTSTFGRIARTTRYLFKKAGNSSITGTLYFPSFSVENNFLALLDRKFEDCCKGFATAASYPGTDSIVRLGSATNLGVDAECIDYIFCDPPFGSNIYYSEVNLLWEAWLGQITDRREEAVVHRDNDRGTKRLPDYAALMEASFLQMYRLLKPGRFATVEFNNSDGQVFEAIKQAARDAGFVIENMVFLDKVQKTFKQLKGDKGEEDVDQQFPDVAISGD